MTGKLAKLAAKALWPASPYINASRQGNVQSGRSVDPCVDCRPRHEPQERRDLDKRRVNLAVEVPVSAVAVWRSTPAWSGCANLRTLWRPRRPWLPRRSRHARAAPLRDSSGPPRLTPNWDRRAHRAKRSAQPYSFTTGLQRRNGTIGACWLSMKRPQRDHLEKSQIEGFDDEANKERAFRPRSQGPMDCPFFMTDRAWTLNAPATRRA
jgi:hypothetical protein